MSNVKLEHRVTDVERREYFNIENEYSYYIKHKLFLSISEIHMKIIGLHVTITVTLWASETREVK